MGSIILSLIRLNVYLEKLLLVTILGLRSIDDDMERCVNFNWIFLVLLITVSTTQAAFIQNRYNKIEQGQNVTGKSKAQFLARSTQECSLRFVEF